MGVRQPQGAARKQNVPLMRRTRIPLRIPPAYLVLRKIPHAECGIPLQPLASPTRVEDDIQHNIGVKCTV